MINQMILDGTSGTTAGDDGFDLSKLINAQQGYGN
jgi:hypothetical protein